jgi:hypothetical protein
LLSHMTRLTGLLRPRRSLKEQKAMESTVPPWREGGKARRYEMLVLHRIQYIRSEDTTSAIL